jgi:VanZ family protein
MNFKRLLKNWLPVCIWLGVIFLGSSDLMSVEHTSRFIVPFLRWLKPDISPETLASIHFIVRKCAHLGEYAVLALLLLRAAILTNLKRSLAILYVSVWVACLFVATTDEFHQTFVASRGASATDIMIDSGGAILGLLIGAIFGITRSIKLERAPADPSVQSRS